MILKLENEGRYNLHNVSDIKINVKEENYIYKDDKIVLSAIQKDNNEIQ